MRVVIAQIKSRKGQVEKNLRQVEEVLEQLAQGPTPDLVLFPEAFLTGYFIENAVGNLAIQQGELVRRLTESYTRVYGAAGPALELVLGFYEEARGTFYNSALYLPLGPGAGRPRVHRKVFLPSYGLFDESRFVTRGSQFRAFAGRKARLGLLLCEDAWHGLSGTILALAGAQMILIPSASPARGMGGERPDNLRTWERLAQGLAAEHGLFAVVAQAVGFEGGKGFAGGSVVTGPRGEILAQAPLWEETLLAVELPLEEITLARAASPLLSDLKEVLPDLSRQLSRLGRTGR